MAIILSSSRLYSRCFSRLYSRYSSRLYSRYSSKLYSRCSSRLYSRYFNSSGCGQIVSWLFSWLIFLQELKQYFHNFYTTRFSDINSILAQVLTYIFNSIDVIILKGFKGETVVIIKKTFLKVVVFPFLFFIICNGPLYKSCDFFYWFSSNI